MSPDGIPALGPDRPTSGVCGAPIRQAALEFVQTARDIIDKRQLGLTLVGVGGVTSAQHAVDMVAAGADFVQSATGMMWNPLLAHEYHKICAQQQQQITDCAADQDQQQQVHLAAACSKDPAKQAGVGVDRMPVVAGLGA